MKKSLILASVLALTLTGCGIKQFATDAWDATSTATSNAASHVASWFTGVEPKEQSTKADLEAVRVIDGSIFDNEKNNYPVVEPNLQFYGVEDQYDIDEQLRAYKTRCKRNDFATCNLLGKYYLQYGEKGRQEAYKWYSVGCNQHKNPYACGVKKYLEAGGY